MKKVILAVGTLKNRPEKSLFDTFYQRLMPPPLLCEIVPKTSSMALETASLLAYLKPDDYIVALDEKGKIVSTKEFHDLLNEWEKQVKRCVFILGGADGLDPILKKRAHFVLSLGKMTWSHLLARALFVEQLYRCQQITLGHPYHRE